MATSGTLRRTTSTRCLTESRAKRWDGDGSGAGRAADVDHIAVTGRSILVDEAGDQYAAIERDDLTILLGTGRSGRTDIILAARAALQTQFLRRRLVGQMHHHAAGLAGADHVRLLALVLRHLFGAGAIGRILERGEAPAADDFVGPDACRHFRGAPGFG